MEDHGPARGAVTITPHDTNAQPIGIRAIYVGGTGDIVLRAIESSADVTLKAVPVGTILPIKAKYIRNTSTTATLMVGLL